MKESVEDEYSQGKSKENTPLKQNLSILIVEDENEIAELVALLLKREGLETQIANSAEDAKEILSLQKNSFDLIICDWMLPGESGIDWVAGFTRQSTVPVLMLTARTSPEDIVQGLDAGADDFVTKPFEPSVLLARVRALLRWRNKNSNLDFTISSQSNSLPASYAWTGERAPLHQHQHQQQHQPMQLPTQPQQLLQHFDASSPYERGILDLEEELTGEFEVGGLKVNAERYEVLCGEDNLHLTPSEFKLLMALLKNRGRVLTRKRLMSQVQGEGVSVIGRTIDTHIFGLRKKLGQYGDLVETVRGVGYRVR